VSPPADPTRTTPEQPEQPGTVPAPQSNSAATDRTDQALDQAAAGTALAGLADLAVHRRGPRTGYARSRFGSALTDTDGNGCDQRNDVLRRDLTEKTLKPQTNGCTVMTGSLRDPYTGRTVAYRRAAGTGVRIDHVVPLGDAWLKGARTWSAAKRAEFATDPLNLLAVAADSTAGKRGADAARWLPPDTANHCGYVARQVAVKLKYGVWVTSAERATIARILTGCGNLGLPRAEVIALGGAPLAGTAPLEMVAQRPLQP
jgi:hypothetical protein